MVSSAGVTAGSRSKTSSPAPAIVPDWSAATSAASSTTSPRAVLIRNAALLHPAEPVGVHEMARLGRGRDSGATRSPPRASTSSSDASRLGAEGGGLLR